MGDDNVSETVLISEGEWGFFSIKRLIRESCQKEPKGDLTD